MAPSTRLKLCLLIVVVSAIYAVVVVHDPHVATSLSTFYVAIVVTVFVIANVWKKSS